MPLFEPMDLFAYHFLSHSTAIHSGLPSLVPSKRPTEPSFHISLSAGGTPANADEAWFR